MPWRSERACWGRATRTPRRRGTTSPPFSISGGTSPRRRRSSGRICEQRRETLGPDHPSVATSMTNLGVVLVNLGDLDGAEPLYRDALRIRTAAYGERHRTVATTRYYLARLLRDRGNASRKPRSSCAARSRTFPTPTRTSPASTSISARCCSRRGRLDEAQTALEDAVRLHAKVDGADHWRTAAARSARGEWRERTGDRKNAEEDLELAWTVLSKRPEDDARRRRAHDRLAGLYQRSGREKEAAGLH